MEVEKTPAGLTAKNKYGNSALVIAVTLVRIKGAVTSMMTVIHPKILPLYFRVIAQNSITVINRRRNNPCRKK